MLNNNADWIVSEPYTLTKEDLDIIDENPVTKASDWGKSVYKPIKDKIRAFYSSKQNNTCCYCRLPINEANAYSHIEHIIDKNNRTDFEFEPRNLVVSCQKCNLAKNTKKVMSVCPPLNDYPNSSKDFKILHGHYDRYSNHIRVLNGSIYQAIDDVGKFTISTCALYRPEIAEQREKEKQQINDLMLQQLQRIMDADNVEEEIRKMTDKLKNR